VPPGSAVGCRSRGKIGDSETSPWVAGQMRCRQIYRSPRYIRRRTLPSCTCRTQVWWRGRTRSLPAARPLPTGVSACAIHTLCLNHTQRLWPRHAEDASRGGARDGRPVWCLGCQLVSALLLVANVVSVITSPEILRRWDRRIRANRNSSCIRHQYQNWYQSSLAVRERHH
jgi:hypothetical protein